MSRWTNAELQILYDNYSGKEIEEIERLLPNHNRNSIYSKASRLGLDRARHTSGNAGKKASDKTKKKLVRSHTKWTEEQEQLLKELYPNIKSSDLESVFPGFTAYQISQRARQIGVRKDYSFFVNTGAQGANAKWNSENENQELERGPSWNEQRRKARKRADYKCEWCKRSEDDLGYQLSVHHIVKFADFGYVPGQNRNYELANRMSNLVCVCRSCHTKIETQDWLKDRQDVLEYFALTKDDPLAMFRTQGKSHESL